MDGTIGLILVIGFPLALCRFMGFRKSFGPPRLMFSRVMLPTQGQLSDVRAAVPASKASSTHLCLFLIARRFEIPHRRLNLGVVISAKPAEKPLQDRKRGPRHTWGKAGKQPGTRLHSAQPRTRPKHP